MIRYRISGVNFTGATATLIVRFHGRTMVETNDAPVETATVQDVCIPGLRYHENGDTMVCYVPAGTKAGPRIVELPWRTVEKIEIVMGSYFFGDVRIEPISGI